MNGLLILPAFLALSLAVILCFPGRIEIDVVWEDSGNKAVFQALFVKGLLGFQIRIDTDRVFHLLILGKKMPG
ncbi:MAG TPA: hypothetical protein ENN17_00910, partial [bacterium]|nr:hypothetical protein [bacterium]